MGREGPWNKERTFVQSGLNAKLYREQSAAAMGRDNSATKKVGLIQLEPEEDSSRLQPLKSEIQTGSQMQDRTFNSELASGDESRKR